MWRKVDSFMLLSFCILLAESDGVNKRAGQTNDGSSKIVYPADFLFTYPDQPHQHHDVPGYHSHYLIDNNERNKDKRQRTLPSFPENTEKKEQFDNSSLEIPLDFIRNINRYNVSDLLLNFVEDDEEELFIKSRFGDDDDGARTAAKTPKSAGCSPELKTISLGQTDDPSVLYIPQCTRVERCGGCCSHSLLSCQPKETETLSYQVMKTKYTGGKKLKYIGKEVVLVERHVSCKCDCKVKEEDCNNYQEYRESECRCACTNLDEEKKCFKSVKKLWNPELCACQCRDVAQCTSGYSFDQIDCKCVPNHMRRRFANDRRGYVTETISPLSFDEN